MSTSHSASSDTPSARSDSVARSPRVLWSFSGREIVEGYESALAAGNPAPVASYLKKVPPRDVPAVLYGLAARDVAHQRSLGLQPCIDDYLAFAPDSQSLLETLLITDEHVADWLAHCGYETHGRIAQGRTGGVYQVSRTADGERSAAILIPAGLVKQQAFDESARSIDLSFMLHRHIARPTELTEFDGNILLFNSFITGPTFRTLAERKSRLSLGAICELMRQAAQGLGWIHDHDQFHAAITPSSLLLVTSGPERGSVKVSGIGINDFANLELLTFAPDPSADKGLAWYRFSAPECIAGENLASPRSDVYALGAVFMALLLGRVPSRLALRFEDRIAREDSHPTGPGGEAALMQQLLQAAAEPVPEGIVSIMDRALSLLPASRFADANEFADALTPFADGGEFAALLEELDQSRIPAARPRIAWSAADTPAADVAPQQEVPAQLQTAAATESGALPDVPAEPQQKAAGSQVVKAEQNEAGHGTPSATPRKWRRIASGIVAAILAIATVWWMQQPAVEAPPAWAIDLAEYPGPAGEWWFTESPWLTPLARERLLDPSVSKGARGLELEAICQRVLQTGSATDRRRLAEEIQRAVIDDDSPSAVVTRQLLTMNQTDRRRETLQQDYRRLAEQLQDVSTVTAVHLRAILLHAAGHFPEATADYRDALARYEQTGQPQLQAVCASDFARLLVEYRQYNLAALQLRERVLPMATSRHLKLFANCLQAEVFRKWDGQFVESASSLHQAAELAGDLPDQSARDWQAVIVEARAWNAFDQWKLPEAHEHFTKVLQQRQAAQAEGEKRGWEAIFWAKQGLAMVDHFVGRQAASIEAYTELLQSIDDILGADAVGALGRLPRTQREQLAARRPNLSERLGDCYLFGPDEDAETAARWYAAAEDHANGDEFDMQAKWPFIMAVNYKRVIALLRTGQTDAAERVQLQTDEYVARKRQAAEKSDANGLERFAEHESVFAMNRRLASLLTDLQTQDSDRTRTLRDLEAALQEMPLTRRSLDMYLLGSQVLFESLDAPPEQVVRIVRRVADTIQGFLQKSRTDDEMRYFQRYAEFAVRSGSIAQARLQHDGQAENDIDNLEQIATRGATLEDPFPADLEQPAEHELHTLTIGVSKYLRHDSSNPLNLPYAAKDATELHRAFQLLIRSDQTLDRETNPPAGDVGLFRAGLTTTLTNESATRKNIFAFFDELKRRRGSDVKNDLVLVSIAGHGVLDEMGFLYFLPYDYEPGALLSSGIDIDQLKKQLSFLRSNAVLILDTCHSGAALSSSADTMIALRSANNAEVTGALQRFASSGRGVIVIAASRAQERAAEGTPFAGHGALTAAVLEFLRQKHFNIETNANQRPVDLRVASQGNVATLEGFRRYVQDRLNQFRHLKQSPLIRVVSGYDVGNYDPARIPLRLLTPR